MNQTAATPTTRDSQATTIELNEAVISAPTGQALASLLTEPAEGKPTMPSPAAIIRRRTPSANTQTTNRAVFYLRVSTVGQVQTDYDPEGISLPAQRKACEQKAAGLGLDVVGEYVEAGKSGTEMTRRDALQAMLARIRDGQDRHHQDEAITHVIVYKLSRLARNSIDEALILDKFRKAGVELVSATEPIDASPEGQFMRGILSAMNQFRSQQDGGSIAYTMGEKAKKGGTLGRAPIGYLNVREIVDGHEVRTVAVDPERAPFVKQAFELYRDGATIAEIQEILTDRGFTTKPTPKLPSKPVSDKKIYELLHDSYYIGVITYKSEEYPGRHEPILDRDLFDQVQERLRLRSSTNTYRRVHEHHLKGFLWCGQCHQKGRENRMILQNTVNRHGETYLYFFCRGLQKHVCESPYVNIAYIEDAVARYYSGVTFSPDFIASMKTALEETIQKTTVNERAIREQVAKQVSELTIKEDRLIDLAADGTLPRESIRDRLRKIREQREKAESQLASIVEDLKAGAANIMMALDFLIQPYDMYTQASEHVRKLLNDAIFEKIYIHAERQDIAETIQVSEAILTEPLRGLKAIEQGVREFITTSAKNEPTQTELRPRTSTRTRHDRRAVPEADTPHDAKGTTQPDGPAITPRNLTKYLNLNLVQGSSPLPMVEHRGLEPLTSTLQRSHSTN